MAVVLTELLLSYRSIRGTEGVAVTMDDVIVMLPMARRYKVRVTAVLTRLQDRCRASLFSFSRCVSTCRVCSFLPSSIRASSPVSSAVVCRASMSWVTTFSSSRRTL